MTDGIIRRWAEKHFSGPPNCIILSHGHFDHVSAAKNLADHWNVPVYAHSLERPYLTGQSEYPSPNPGAGGGMMSVLSPTLPRGPIDLGDRLHDLPSEAESCVGLFSRLENSAHSRPHARTHFLFPSRRSNAFAWRRVLHHQVRIVFRSGGRAESGVAWPAFLLHFGLERGARFRPEARRVKSFDHCSRTWAADLRTGGGCGAAHIGGAIRSDRHSRQPKSQRAGKLSLPGLAPEEA